jgi:PRTRC genetic system protein A
MKPVGYLLNTTSGLEGNPDQFYNYVLAGNGLYVQASNPFLSATMCLARAHVRGLAPLTEHVGLIHGKIPARLYDLATSILTAASPCERYLAVTWEGEYRLRQPAQQGSSSHVEYNVLPNTVLDIHSHGSMKAFFSQTDDRDEQGLRLYVVVGRLDMLIPEVEMRLGIYGYFAPIELREVFDV